MINIEEVERIGSLARMTLTADEKAKFAQQLSAILDSFKALAQVDTEGVEALVTPTDLEVVFREDKVEQALGAELALANAPEKTGHIFRVPPVD